MYILIRKLKDEKNWRTSVHNHNGYSVLVYSDHDTALSALKEMRYLFPDAVTYIEDYNNTKYSAKMVTGNSRSPVFLVRQDELAHWRSLKKKEIA
tara:strand:+ start:3991 stop:4275 length:285 start_codon:yes stop_codon:yes gene_type:complete